MCQICIINDLTNEYISIYTYLSVTKLKICENIDYLSEYLINLTELDCSNSKELFMLPITYFNLKMLNCSTSPIHYLPHTYINLNYLDCSYSGIFELSNNYLHLEYLDCSYTFIETLPSGMTKLEQLICNNSEISIIPNNIYNVEFINCSDTDVDYIPETIINLTTLDCANTLVQQLPDTLINLEVLYCNRTQINILHLPKTLINLKEIHMKYVPDSLIKYVLARQKKIRHGFVRIINIYRYNKNKNILWEIAEYYTAKKYSPNGIAISNYINMFNTFQD